MKVSEAPKKLYTDSSGNNPMSKRYRDSDVEYVRTDAFIEKACEWLKKNADNYTWYDETEGESGMTDDFINDFKNYMEGENKV